MDYNMDEDFAELERMAEAADAQDAELEDLHETTSRRRIDTTQAPADREYLVKLEGPMSSAHALRDIARLPTIPKIIQTQSEDDGLPVQFCRINGTAKNNIVDWLLHNIGQISFRPTFIPTNRAPKDFDPSSPVPTLGWDSTMPQNKPHTITTITSSPLQDEYPVWYFFYGTLANTETLKRLFSELDEDVQTEYVLYPARVRGGKLTTTRANAYKALVNDDGLYPAEPIQGHAFLVKTEEHEDALRYYETNLYEVVRCRIEFEEQSSGTVGGCTFRFRGNV